MNTESLNNLNTQQAIILLKQILQKLEKSSPEAFTLLKEFITHYTNDENDENLNNIESFMNNKNNDENIKTTKRLLIFALQLHTKLKLTFNKEENEEKKIYNEEVHENKENETQYPPQKKNNISLETIKEEDDNYDDDYDDNSILTKKIIFIGEGEHTKENSC